MNRFASATQFDLDKEKDFGTMDTYFSTNFSNNMELDPQKVIQPFQQQLVSISVGAAKDITLRLGECSFGV